MGRHIGDFDLRELQNYKPQLHIPADFDDFWLKQQKEIRSSACQLVKREVRKYGVPSVTVEDIIFQSWDDTPLRGIIVRPKNVEQQTVLMDYHGYTGGKGLPIDYTAMALLGITVVSFDVRGQGDSPDFARYENGSKVQGWMTNGIFNPEGYYYVNVYKDIIAQLKWLREESGLYGGKLGVTGYSQGGGLALVAAALDQSVGYVAASCPFNTHYERAINIALSGPYMEIIDFLKRNDPENTCLDRIMQTLAYTDALHFCPEINVPVLMGTGLEDPVTPPSSTFAAFNHLGTVNKQLEVYPQYNHEIIRHHEEKKLSFIYQHAFSE